MKSKYFSHAFILILLIQLRISANPIHTGPPPFLKSAWYAISLIYFLLSPYLIYRVAKSKASFKYYIVYPLIFIFLIFPVFLHFIETQSESPHVSPTHSNTRSLATALQAYYVDHGKYPEYELDIEKNAYGIQNIKDKTFYDKIPTFKHYTGYKYHTLTTPVAYIFDYFEDIFSPDSTTFAYYANQDGWILWSPCADQDFDINYDIVSKIDIRKAESELIQYIYDSTNGTVSNGDFVRSMVTPIEINNQTNNVNSESDIEKNKKEQPTEIEYDPTNGTVSWSDSIRVKQ